MAYDEGLASRIRDLIGPDPELTEKKMFGGLAFLIRGHMAISASAGGALVRVDPARTGELVNASQATIMVMRGREMDGWLRVKPEHLATDGDLSPWVEMSIAYARSLPPKKPARKKPTP